MIFFTIFHKASTLQMMTRRYLDLSKVITATEYIFYVYSGLQVTFWDFRLRPVCFTIKKIILSQICYFPANIYLFKVKFEHISHLFLVFPLLTSNK